MRLSFLGSIIRAIELLLPAAITLLAASLVWSRTKRIELSERRLATFRWGLFFAWVAMGLILVASIDQLDSAGTARVLVGNESVRRNLCHFRYRRSIRWKGLEQITSDRLGCIVDFWNACGGCFNNSLRVI